MARGQDARLIPLIQECLKEAGLDFPSLDRIAVTRGPGSFTGIRIGLAAAQGLALALDKPVLGIDRFAIFGRQFAGQNPWIFLESKRVEKFVAGRIAPCMMTPDEIAVAWRDDELGVGDIAQIGERPLAPAMEEEVLTACRLAFEADPADPAMAPLPLYLRAPDVTVKKA
jgi:tRNA threonylcarbamoyladenosine biosynthesis protein TsaB